MDLKGRRAVVTGASRGIGAAIADALVEKGARVAGLARSVEPLDEIARRPGEAFLAVPCDVRDPAAVRAAVGRVVEAAGRIDILINNAGVGRFGPVDEIGEA